MAMDGARVLGCYLSEWRVRKGWTQQQAADALSIHRPTLSVIEQGKQAVKVIELMRFVQVYGVDESDWVRCLIEVGQVDTRKGEATLAPSF